MRRSVSERYYPPPSGSKIVAEPRKTSLAHSRIPSLLTQKLPAPQASISAMPPPPKPGATSSKRETPATPATSDVFVGGAMPNEEW